jgi:AraC-like DNA-binding protein
VEQREPIVAIAVESLLGVERGSGDELYDLVARLAADTTGCGPVELGIRFHRLVQPVTFHKTVSLGPSLTVVVRGRKRVWFGGRELAYDAGHYIVILGETTFDGEVIGASPDNPYLAVTLDLPIDVIVKMQLALPVRELPSAGDDPAVAAYVAPFDRVLRSTVTRLLAATEDSVERRVLVPLLQDELVFRLLRSDAAAVIRPPVAARDAQVIQQAMRFIRDNATRALSVQAVARHVAMSPSHFAHRFREVAHVSPMRYLKRVRLDAARDALRTRPLRVAELAAQVGYESTSHFSHDFKQAFGITPAELARRIAGSGASTAAASIAWQPPRP